MFQSVEGIWLAPKMSSLWRGLEVKSQMWAATAAPNLARIQVRRLEWCWARFLPPIDHLLPKKKAHGHRCFWQRILAILTCLKFFVPPRAVMQWCYKKQFPHCCCDRYGGQCFESKPESTPFGEPLKRSYLGAGGAQLDDQFQFHRIHYRQVGRPHNWEKQNTHICLYGCSCEAYWIRSFGVVFTCYISIVCPVIWISTGRFWNTLPKTNIAPKNDGFQ